MLWAAAVFEWLKQAREPQGPRALVAARRPAVSDDSERGSYLPWIMAALVLVVGGAKLDAARPLVARGLARGDAGRAGGAGVEARGRGHRDAGASGDGGRLGHDLGRRGSAWQAASFTGARSTGRCRSRASRCTRPASARWWCTRSRRAARARLALPATSASRPAFRCTCRATPARTLSARFRRVLRGLGRGRRRGLVGRRAAGARLQEGVRPRGLSALGQARSADRAPSRSSTVSSPRSPRRPST